MFPGGVRPEKQQELQLRMRQLHVCEQDLQESFVRASGPGGQHVNKVATCVVLTHRPTGLSVKCQASRHQGLNRFFARRLLLDKIEHRQQGFVSSQRAYIEKIRRQKRKRSQRAKEKMLANKRQHSQKKEGRQRLSMARLSAHL